MVTATIEVVVVSRVVVRRFVPSMEGNRVSSSPGEPKGNARWSANIVDMVFQILSDSQKEVVRSMDYTRRSHQCYNTSSFFTENEAAHLSFFVTTSQHSHSQSSDVKVRHAGVAVLVLSRDSISHDFQTFPVLRP